MDFSVLVVVDGDGACIKSANAINVVFIPFDFIALDFITLDFITGNIVALDDGSWRSLR